MSPTNGNRFSKNAFTCRLANYFSNVTNHKMNLGSVSFPNIFLLCWKFSNKEDTNCSNLLNFMRSLRETQKEIWFWAHNAFIINSKSYLPQKYYFINCKSIIQKWPTKKLMKNSKNLFGRVWSAEEFNGTRVFNETTHF